ncbi:MAG: prepilin-type N-terminal cleavage/methylation domain-containing protein [Deltaproteobacteria bacterium]|nr:prepilin-type N-terminal cleavage/methylation domain-containing protein [Deltaproteobacteria bacterium]
MKLLRENRGFTLIEVAIVMVIIGILMGAVLRGQEMIKNAKEKNFHAKIRFLASAQFTYLDRMGEYAGDTTATPDGIIDDNTTAWTELTYQQILKDVDERHVFNGQFTFDGGDAPYGNYNYILASRIPMWVAQSFDIKLDDGVGNTGNVRWQTLTGVAYDPTADPNSANNLYWWFDR